MKLIFCTVCHDIVKLTTERRTCVCRESSGYYKRDLRTVKISGPAVPIGILNNEFMAAVEEFKKTGKEGNFTSFVIPKTSIWLDIGE